MSLDADWSRAVDALRRRRRGFAPRPLLADAARYRKEAARCTALAAQASDPAIQAQLAAIVDTYRRLARQLEVLDRLS